MKPIRHSAGAALALTGALLLSIASCGGHQTQDAGGEVIVDAKLARVERIEAPRTIELYGTVEAEMTATVSVRVMAVVTAVLAQAGQRVRQGELLLRIDPQAAEGQLAQAKGALGQARAGLALAERNFERFKALAAVDAASELELDMARMQFEQALGAVEQAEGAVAAAGSVAADSSVVAPFAGTVVRRMVEVGDLAAPGRPLLAIESHAGRRLVLSVPESVMVQAGLSVGDSLTVSLDARPELGAITAQIVEASAGADPASHSFQIEVALPMDGIPSGASGRARVEIERRPIVAIPGSAVLRQGGLSMVVVRLADGRAGSRVVTLGEPLADGRLEVLSGLAGGETVALGLSSTPPAGAVLKGLAEPKEPAS